MWRGHKLEGEAQVPGEDPTSLQGDGSRTPVLCTMNPLGLCLEGGTDEAPMTGSG